MATTALFDVIDALLAMAREIWPQDTPDQDIDVLVIDGNGVTDDPSNFLMIGVDAVDDTGDSEAYSGESRQDWANATFTARDEWGDVNCIALGWNGDGDQQLARNEVRTITDQLENALRANPTLGLPTLLWTGF